MLFFLRDIVKFIPNTISEACCVMNGAGDG